VNGLLTSNEKSTKYLCFINSYANFFCVYSVDPPIRVVYVNKASLSSFRNTSFLTKKGFKKVFNALTFSVRLISASSKRPSLVLRPSSKRAEIKKGRSRLKKFLLQFSFTKASKPLWIRQFGANLTTSFLKYGWDQIYKPNLDILAIGFSNVLKTRDSFFDLNLVTFSVQSYFGKHKENMMYLCALMPYASCLHIRQNNITLVRQRNE
jgi:hypothetical protein